MAVTTVLLLTLVVSLFASGTSDQGDTENDIGSFILKKAEEVALAKKSVLPRRLRNKYKKGGRKNKNKQPDNAGTFGGPQVSDKYNKKGGRKNINKQPDNAGLFGGPQVSEPDNRFNIVGLFGGPQIQPGGNTDNAGLFGGPQIQPGRNTDNAGLFGGPQIQPGGNIDWSKVILHEEEELAKKSVVPRRLRNKNKKGGRKNKNKQPDNAGNFGGPQVSEPDNVFDNAGLFGGPQIQPGGNTDNAGLFGGPQIQPGGNADNAGLFGGPQVSEPDNSWFEDGGIFGRQIWGGEEELETEQ